VEERRRHQRTPFERHLLIQRPGEPAFTVRAHDISSSGLSFFAEQPFKLGEPVTALVRHSGDPDPVLLRVCHVRALDGYYLIGAERQA
jgi:hypothetical protein